MNRLASARTAADATFGLVFCHRLEILNGDRFDKNHRGGVAVIFLYAHVSVCMYVCVCVSFEYAAQV